MHNDNDELTVYFPGRSFPAVSVTGEGCDLMCEHCKGSHLKGMSAADTVPKMMHIIDGIIASGGEGLLISGGCDINGAVPVIIAEDAVRYASENGLKVNVHAGFAEKEDIRRLRDAGASAFSADVHQDPAIIGGVLHLNVPSGAYADLLDVMTSLHAVTVPHLTAGFGAADLTGSAELVKSKGFGEVVLLALVPTKGTVTEDRLISEDAIVDAAEMLLRMGFSVILGCMRPRIHRDLEIRCIEAGVRRIANPSRRTLEWAAGKGMRIIGKRTCCCFR